MSKYIIEGDTLSGIAEAIRNKTGETAAIPVPDMAAKIESIGGGDITDSVKLVEVSVEEDCLGAKVRYSTLVDGQIALIDTEFGGSTKINVISNSCLYVMTNTTLKTVSCVGGVQPIEQGAKLVLCEITYDELFGCSLAIA